MESIISTKTNSKKTYQLKISKKSPALHSFSLNQRLIHIIESNLTLTHLEILKGKPTIGSVYNDFAQKNETCDNINYILISQEPLPDFHLESTTRFVLPRYEYRVKLESSALGGSYHGSALNIFYYDNVSKLSLYDLVLKIVPHLD